MDVRRELTELETYLRRRATCATAQPPPMADAHAWAQAVVQAAGALAQVKAMGAELGVHKQAATMALDQLDELDSELGRALARVGHLEQQLRAARADRDHQAGRATAAEAQAGHLRTLLDKRDRELAANVHDGTPEDHGVFADVVRAAEREARLWRGLFNRRRP